MFFIIINIISIIINKFEKNIIPIEKKPVYLIWMVKIKIIVIVVIIIIIIVIVVVVNLLLILFT